MTTKPRKQISAMKANSSPGRPDNISTKNDITHIMPPSKTGAARARPILSALRCPATSETAKVGYSMAIGDWTIMPMAKLAIGTIASRTANSGSSSKVGRGAIYIEASVQVGKQRTDALHARGEPGHRIVAGGIDHGIDLGADP